MEMDVVSWDIERKGKQISYEGTKNACFLAMKKSLHQSIKEFLIERQVL